MKKNRIIGVRFPFSGSDFTKSLNPKHFGMMHLRLTLGIFLSNLIAFQLPAQVNYQWALQLGSTQYDHSTGIIEDLAGNVYTTGTFLGTVDFDPGTGTANLTTLSMMAPTAYLAKYDASGNYVWAFSLPSTCANTGHKLAVDNQGCVYWSGNFGCTVDFDPGTGITSLSSSGTNNDIFLAKYTSSGTLIWAKCLTSGSSAVGIVNDMDWDGSGAFYITGYISDTTDFDPGPGTASIISNGGQDVFLAKFDTSGNYTWAFNTGAGNHDHGRSLAISGSGEIIITGKFYGTADFDPGSGAANLTAPGTMPDIFVAAYSFAGNYLRSFRIGASTTDEGNGISVDGNGNIYITGRFYGTVDFDPGTGTMNLTATSLSYDIFFAKYTATGSYVWAKRIGSTQDEEGTFIRTDPVGNVYLAGKFINTVDFDPGPGTANLVASSGMNLFIAMYDNAGAYIWAGQWDCPSSLNETLYDLYLSPGAGLFAAGYFEATIDMDPGTGSVLFTSAGLRDAFIGKYNSVLTGIPSPWQNSGLAAFPNPVSSVLHISLPEPSKIEILDLSGRLLLYTFADAALEMDVSSLQPGLYALRIMGKEERLSRFIVH